MSVSITALKDLVTGTRAISIRKEWVKSVNNDGTLELSVPTDLDFQVPEMANSEVASIRAENESLKSTISALQAKAEAESTAHMAQLTKLEEKFSNKFSELEKKMDPPVAKASPETAPRARRTFAQEVNELKAYDDNMLPAHAIFYWGARNRDRDNQVFSNELFTRVRAQEMEETRRVKEWYS